MYANTLSAICKYVQFQNALCDLAKDSIRVKLGSGSGQVRSRSGLKLDLGLWSGIGQKFANLHARFRNFTAHFANCAD